MQNPIFQKPPAVCPPLALRPKEAAEAIGISERLLIDWTHEHGLPCIRLGRVVLYPVDLVREWLNTKSQPDLVPPESPARPVLPAPRTNDLRLSGPVSERHASAINLSEVIASLQIPQR